MFRITNDINQDGISEVRFTVDELVSDHFQVWYRYKAASQGVLSSSTRHNMTGFRLSWSIKNGTNRTLSKSPPNKNDNLRMMVNLAAQARLKNVSQDDLFLQVITQKENILGENTNTSCTKEHIDKKESQHLFDSIGFRMNKAKGVKSIDWID